MIDYVKRAVEFIAKNIIDASGNMYLLSGDQGIGKTTIAKCYCEIHKDTLNFSCGDEMEFLSLLSPKTAKKEYYRHLSLYKPLIKKIKQEQIHNVIFDVDKKTNEDFLDLIANIYNIINRQKYNLNVLILISNKTYHDYCNFFDNHPRLIYIHPLCKWTKNDFLQLWEELYHNSEFNSKAISLISEYSMGNVSIFLHHLNTLKYYDVFVFENQQWKINNNECIEEILTSEYSDVVQKKYEALSPELQTIIMKTSSIGYIFNSNTLKDVFNVKNSKKVLEEIERLSMLLYYTDSAKQEGRFDSEDVQRQIQGMIGSEQLAEWCELLGNYYELRAKKYPYISIERCIAKEKCILYFEKSNNTDKLVFHYITLISLRFYLSQYKSAIDITTKLLLLTEKLLQYKQIHSYCYYMLAVINKAIANYPIAITNLDKYIELSNTESPESNALKAELLYDIGDTPKAYSILKDLYKSKEYIYDPSLLVNIVSMLSSIEETMGIKKYISHFNEALAIASENKLDIHYYRLLRKANMVHLGENAIMLMNEAKKFFIKNNMLTELIMVKHNIGTEALFYENTYKYACANLESAREIACRIGFSQLCYIDNSLALYAILQGKYSKAIEILNGLLEYYQEDFTLLTVYLNKATCLRTMGLYEDACSCINNAVKTNEKEENKFPFFSAQITLHKAFLCLEKGQIDSAFINIVEYLQRDYDDRDVNTISAKIVLNKMCDMYKLDKPKELNGFSDDYDDVARRMADNHLVLCELMFWE